MTTLKCLLTLMLLSGCAANTEDKGSHILSVFCVGFCAMQDRGSDASEKKVEIQSIKGNEDE
jgi:hypothetical protein